MDVMIFKNDAFLAFCNLDSHAPDYLSAENVVARRGFGRTLHRLLMDIAQDMGKQVTITRNGDARGGAMLAWVEFFDDPSIEHHPLPAHLNNDINWTNEEMDPFLFHAYSAETRILPKNNIQYTHFDDAQNDPSLEKKMQLCADIFDVAYDNHSNTFIDKDMPLYEKPPQHTNESLLIANSEVITYHPSAPAQATDAHINRIRMQ